MFWHISLCVKLGFCHKICWYSSNQGISFWYSTETLVLSLDLCWKNCEWVPVKCEHDYMYECAWAITVVVTFTVSDADFNKPVSLQLRFFLTPDYIVPWTDLHCLTRCFLANPECVCIYAGGRCCVRSHLYIFKLTSCHYSPQGAGGVLCERKHLQGEAEAFLHQKPKVK